MQEEGFVSLYHNSGAFGFADGVTVHTRGWIGSADESIRPEAMRFVREIPAPHEKHFAGLLVQAWREHLPGRVWILPKSHWAYELQFGNRELLTGALERLGLDPCGLADQNNGAAIEFSLAEEAAAFESFAARLLGQLRGSDFMIAFPGRKTLCTVHHHKQLWWQTSDPQVLSSLDRLVDEISQPNR